MARPQFKATPALRRKVEELASCGMTQDDIVRAVGCSTPTLAKHFEDELATGAAKKRAEVIALLYKQARKGNVTAQKKLEELTRATAVPEAGAGTAPGDLGKKQQQQLAASRVTGVFAPPEPPKLVVDNG